MKVVLDTNCFIDAVNCESRAYEPLQRILAAGDSGQLKLLASRHSLHELKAKSDTALDLAKSVEPLPYFPVGTWEEQVAAWNQIAGTWEDSARNEAIQQDLKRLAKAGANIRDRGAYVDALCAHANVFVTSDTDLVGDGPAARIEAEYGLRIITTKRFASQLPNE